MLQNNVLKLISEQCVNWELAFKNYTNLSKLQQRVIEVNGLPVQLQFNPARIQSSAAKTDKQSITERACFLCAKNRPLQQQKITVELESKTHRTYDILVNPFPIFKKHLTIAETNHCEQLLSGRIIDMLELAKKLPCFTLFYNGAECGASAPDHFHFQVCEKGNIPIDNNSLHKSCFFQSHQLSIHTKLYLSKSDFLRSALVVKSDDLNDITHYFKRIYVFLSNGNKKEPMMNILCNFDTNQYKLIIFPRLAQRPTAFYEEGDKQIIVSPASVEMGGKIILPRVEDFNKLKREHIISIYKQVSLFIDNKKIIDYLKS